MIAWLHGVIKACGGKITNPPQQILKMKIPI